MSLMIVVIENQAVLANGVLLGGHVLVGSESFLGEGCGSSFVRIGRGSMVGGLWKFPGCGSSGSRFRKKSISGLNLIGLKRRYFPGDLLELKNCFRLLFEQNNLPRAATEILNGGTAHLQKSPEIFEFFTSGKRGFARYIKKRLLNRDEFAKFFRQIMIKDQ